MESSEAQIMRKGESTCPVAAVQTHSLVPLGQPCPIFGSPDASLLGLWLCASHSQWGRSLSHCLALFFSVATGRRIHTPSAPASATHKPLRDSLALPLPPNETCIRQTLCAVFTLS